MNAKGLSELYCPAAAVGCAVTGGACCCTGTEGSDTLGCGVSTGANENESPEACALISSNMSAWCVSVAVGGGCEAGMGKPIDPRFTGFAGANG